MIIPFICTAGRVSQKQKSAVNSSKIFVSFILQVDNMESVRDFGALNVASSSNFCTRFKAKDCKDQRMISGKQYLLKCRMHKDYTCSSQRRSEH